MSCLCASDDKNTGASASASVLPGNSGLISLKIDWFDLLAVPGTFRILLQHHNLKASILWHSAFFTVPLSQPYVATGKTKPIGTFVGRVVSAFQPTVQVCHCFPANKQSFSDFMAAVTICSNFESQEEEICHYFHLFPFYLPLSNLRVYINSL